MVLMLILELVYNAMAHAKHAMDQLTQIAQVNLKNFIITLNYFKAVLIPIYYVSEMYYKEVLAI